MSALGERLLERTMAGAVPLSVHVDLTMRCNEQCVHCYRVIEARRELTTVEVKALLADLARAGTLYLTFSGGEVFLRTDLFELIAEAKRLRFDLRLKSNALLVTDERARRLRELGVRQVDVSIYSVDPAVHDAVTLTCAGCEAATFCTRCPGQALVEDGDLYGPSRAACEHALAGAELAGVAVAPASLASLRRSRGAHRHG
jgi:hypothetical protein